MPGLQQHKSGHATSFDYVEHYREDAETFDYFVPHEDAATRHENRRLHESILGQLPEDFDTVLDVGCGGGWVASSLLHKGKTVVSFDISFENVRKVLSQNVSDQHFGVVGDVLSLPFKDDTFDVVISAEVMEHVADVDKYMRNLLRVVKPGGRVIISTPYKENIQHSLCIHCNKMTPHNAHLRSFNECSLANYEKSDRVALSTFVFSNKALLFARTHKVLKYAPHVLWKVVDRMANLIINKPSRIIYVVLLREEKTD